VSEQIYIDYEIFETVLSNLLSNAFKFTFEGGVTIAISNSRKHIKISVTDTGNGINPTNQKKIFQRFAKFETSAARSLDGMGIGLPLVKDLVEIHGGIISVNSTPKRGSEFIVSLPKGISHIPPDQIGYAGPENHGSSLRGTIGEIESWPGRDVSLIQNVDDLRVMPTVVVAESDKEMRSYMVRSLTSKYKVLEADNGQQVLNLITSGFIPDLIVADAAMPRMDGFELLSSIKNTCLQTTVPVILLIAKSTIDEEVKGLYYGADDYLAKPFSSRELLARVETRIEISQAGKKPVQSLTKANTELEEQVHHYMAQLETFNKELEEKNAKLSSMNDELTGLTFAASHDLREPMRKIRLFIGRLVNEHKDSLKGDAEYYFQRILAFVQTMNDLVNDISLYANFNNTIGTTSNIDLRIMLSSLVDFLTPMLKEKGASIEFEVTEGLIGNFDQVRQAIYNLISNALKFRRRDVPLKISVSGRLVPGNSIDNHRADRHKNYYEVKVSDNGIGIDSAYYKQIFELFRRLHKPSDYPGTGIGLAIVRRIVENHNGFVTVASAAGDGSIFSCYFPAAVIS
jgi:signal transduction histidine kinase